MKTAERQFTTISGVPVEPVYGPDRLPDFAASIDATAERVGESVDCRRVEPLCVVDGDENRVGARKPVEGSCGRRSERASVDSSVGGILPQKRPHERAPQHIRRCTRAGGSYTVHDRRRRPASTAAAVIAVKTQPMFNNAEANAGFGLIMPST